MRFEELRVWKEAMEMAKAVYALPVRDANLRDQVRRATTSVAANIAEGAGAGSDAEFARFARSCDEIRAHLRVAVAIGVTADATQILAAAERTGKMLTRLIQALAPP